MHRHERHRAIRYICTRSVGKDGQNIPDHRDKEKFDILDVALYNPGCCRFADGNTNIVKEERNRTEIYGRVTRILC